MQGKVPLAYAPRPDWFDDAACRGMGPGIFFPTREDPHDPAPSVAAAKAVCARCTTTKECYGEWQSLPWELRRHGVWGALTVREREAMRGNWCIDCGEPFDPSGHHYRRCLPCRVKARETAVREANARRARAS